MPKLTSHLHRCFVCGCQFYDEGQSGYWGYCSDACADFTGGTTPRPRTARGTKGDAR